MKKAFQCLALMSVLAGIAFADTISAVPSSTQVQSGSSFMVDITDTGATNLAGFQFDLSWNPSILSLAGESEGTFLATAGTTYFIPGTIDNASGSITFTADSLIGSGSGAIGNGSLANLTFLAIASGASNLSLSNIILEDSLGNSLNFTSVDGSVAVSAASTSAVPEPSSLLLLSTGLCCGVGKLFERYRGERSRRLAGRC